MSKEFNVPPVIFPSASASSSSVPNHCRAPTPSFTLNPNPNPNPTIPFLSFDFASSFFSAPITSAASTAAPSPSMTSLLSSRSSTSTPARSGSRFPQPLTLFGSTLTSTRTPTFRALSSFLWPSEEFLVAVMRLNMESSEREGSEEETEKEKGSLSGGLEGRVMIRVWIWGRGLEGGST